MKIVILDDYQDAVRTLDCFPKLAGHEVTIYHDTVKDPAALAERLKDAEALVLIRERSKITEELLARLPGLRVISQTGGGFPHIDVAACTRHGVALAAPVAMKEPVNPGKQTSSSTAELTFALVMASMRHLPQEVTALKAGHWQTTLGRSLSGQTLGIYGFGLIGSQVAGYGRAFGMNILAWGREGSLNRATEQGYAIAASRESFFETADVVSLHLKLSDDTRGMVTRADLDRMKPSALLVNTSRAGLVEPGALLAALKAGRPGFAALDVYEDEPVSPDNPLLALPNVICTPHLGYVEKTSYENLFSTAFDQVNAFAAGQPINIVNPAVLGNA
ncbi:MAG: D-2-hydroxyacid dehydrogenase family protein [Chloroflexi bacterium]|nr:D-2-hydroxyacid dehydrogenase family protein [Chloroflexota bacterium]OJV94053.1 MAG: 3-phosphoglycerate dehydrogenase [Chloroflexi bacterium 54-19]